MPHMWQNAIRASVLFWHQKEGWPGKFDFHPSCLWFAMVPYGSLWFPYGSLMVPLWFPYGSLWFPMVPHGSSHFFSFPLFSFPPFEQMGDAYLGRCTNQRCCLDADLVSMERCCLWWMACLPFFTNPRFVVHHPFQGGWNMMGLKVFWGWTCSSQSLIAWRRDGPTLDFPLKKRQVRRMIRWHAEKSTSWIKDREGLKHTNKVNTKERKTKRATYDDTCTVCIYKYNKL